jgi:hypothetical protein
MRAVKLNLGERDTLKLLAKQDDRFGAGVKLYKYRGFSNLLLALDIFANKRLYAANYEALNDPMEGRYVYSKGSLTQEQVRSIRGSKAKFNLLSLSATHNSLLMWSYYGEGHSGFVVGVRIVDPNASVERVDYVKALNLRKLAKGLPPEEMAKHILCRKLNLWAHEQEYRVFKRLVNQAEFDSYISVEITDLYFGIRTEPVKAALIESVARAFCPAINVKRLQRGELDSPASLGEP